ncbi:MAG: OB-fold nucleic acid binding domain-containing protein, partial [Dehalococcoidia bacterium]|nr:OB-fold nucleic acid binding domain-containing protein [Dehalococcoidia bacterium]
IEGSVMVAVAGMVVTRQAPGTAKGHVFLTLEDEYGLVNVVLRPQVYEKYRRIARQEPIILVEGILQRKDGVTNVIATSLTPLKRKETPALPEARSFR